MSMVATILSSKVRRAADWLEVTFLNPHSLTTDNFARAAAYQPRWDDWLRNSYLNLTCNDFAGRCGSTTFAYHVDPEPKPYPVLNFCPLFFEQRSFEEAVEYAMSDRERSYDLRSYDNNHGGLTNRP